MNFLLAQLVADDPLPRMAPLSRSALERWLVIGAVFLVVVAVFVWAAFIRQRRRRRKHHHRHRRSVTETAAQGVAEIQRHVRNRKLRRRRHRTLNPTLAETGGLPPARDDEPPPPLPAQPPS